MSDLVLYSTAGCHLCEVAEALLEQLRQQGHSITWSVIDIADDDALFERYGWLIPVLARVADGRIERELRWPFDEQVLGEFLRHSAGPR